MRKYRYSDIDRIVDAGYSVREFSEWHYKVEGRVNVWPSSRKFMLDYAGGASAYDDVLEAVRSLIGSPGDEPVRDCRPRIWAENEREETDGQRHARILWDILLSPVLDRVSGKRTR